MVTDPADWQSETIADVASIVQGGTPSTLIREYWDGGITWVTPTDITGLRGMRISKSARTISQLGLDNSTAVLLPANTILLCSRATIGALALSMTQMATNQGFKNLICKAGVDPLFLAYALSTKKEEMLRLSIGTTFLEISKSNLAQIVLRMPLFLEQRAIAEVLSGFDEHLTNLDELIAKKKAIRDGALEELVTGRTRIADYKDPWVTRSARELLTNVITGGTPSTAIDEYWNGSIPWLSSTEIHQRMVSRPTRSISEEGLENSSAQIAPAGSVLIALAGQGKTRGTSAFLTRDMALNQSLAGLVANETELHREYLLYMLTHRYEELRGLSSGDGGRGGLNKTLLWNLWFTLPSDLQEQCAIAEVLLGMDEEIRLLEEERAKVERLKSGAMDDLLTGRVRLPIEERAA